MSTARCSRLTPYCLACPCGLLLLGPRGSGKTVFLQSLIVDHLRTKGGGSCFLHIYVWSPSINIDPVWGTVKDFAKKVLKQKEEECFFEDFLSLIHI